MKLTVSNQLVTLGELRQAWLEPVRVDPGAVMVSVRRKTQSSAALFAKNPNVPMSTNVQVSRLISAFALARKSPRLTVPSAWIEM